MSETEQKTEIKTEDAKQEEGMIDFAKAIVFAAAIAIFIRTFLFEPFNIPSGSMFPTLLVGDYLFVEKYAYGYGPYSFPITIPNMKGRFFEDMPERGDIAVFRHPTKPGIDYIKRVVGLPGDKVQVKGGVLNINGKPVLRDYRNPEFVSERGDRTEKSHMLYKKYIETLPNGLKHYIYEIGDRDFFDDTDLFIVPNGFYFVMGDNRDSSLDSRAQEQVGFIPADNLIGRALFLFFSTEGAEGKCEKEGFMAPLKSSMCKLVEWPKAIRFKRFFSVINKIDADGK